MQRVGDLPETKRMINILKIMYREQMRDGTKIRPNLLLLLFFNKIDERNVRMME